MITLSDLQEVSINYPNWFAFATKPTNFVSSLAVHSFVELWLANELITSVVELYTLSEFFILCND